MNETKENSSLPEGWKWVKLGEVCNKIGDIDHKMPNQLLSGYPYVSTKDFTDDLKISFDHVKYISKEDYLNLSRKIRPEKGDIIFPRYGTIGKNILVDFDKEFLVSYSCAVIKPNHNLVLSKYVYLFSLSPIVSKEIKKYTVETTQANVGIASIKSFVFPFPPLEIQQAIVSKIDELFSELDKSVEILRLAQQQLKTYRQAVLKWAFEGKLTEEWREQQRNLISGNKILAQILFEKNKIADVQKKKTKELPKLNDEELEELFTIPKEWVWTKNETYLFEVKDGTHDTPKYFEEGIPFITQKNIREQGLEFTDTQFISQEDHQKFYQRSNVAKGDVLISMIGHNRGMTAIVNTDDVFSIKNVGLFKFLPSYQSNKFSFYYYQSKVGLNIVLRKSKGGAQPFIGLTELRNWPVVVCSLQEQEQIVQEIESRLSVADKMEESIIQSLQQAEALRQSILKKAFEGKLINLK